MGWGEGKHEPFKIVGRGNTVGMWVWFPKGNFLNLVEAFLWKSGVCVIF